jgi:hypothetical protein
MRISKTLMNGAVAAVAVAGTANAAIVIDNFTQAQAGITTWNYSGNGASVDGVGPTDLTFGSPGSGILGKRLICTNSQGALNMTASATMNGNGQLAVSLFGGDWGDNQLMSQYKFASAIDMTQGGQTHIYIAGSGNGVDGAGGGYGIGIILFSNLRVGTVITDWTGPDLDVPVYGPGAAYDMRASWQIDMNGSNSIGNLSFNVLDILAQNGADASYAASINGFAVFQYAYGGSTWNYTATSFSIVPAPGALALLGAAGLVGGARRRR